MVVHAAHQGEPLALTVNFAGSKPTTVRTNRSMQHSSAQMHQRADMVTTAITTGLPPRWIRGDADKLHVANDGSCGRYGKTCITAMSCRS